MACVRTKTSLAHQTSLVRLARSPIPRLVRQISLVRIDAAKENGSPIPRLVRQTSFVRIETAKENGRQVSQAPASLRNRKLSISRECSRTLR